MLSNSNSRKAITVSGSDMRIDIYIHSGSDAKLDQLIATVNQLVIQGATMSVELEALTIEVQKNTDVEQSALLLINGIQQRLIDAGSDPVKLNALTSTLGTSADALAAAVAANTPSAAGASAARPSGVAVAHTVSPTTPPTTPKH